MSIGFNRILVPVDFTANTEVAIRKALSLCSGSDAAIHLLHVSPPVSNGIFSLDQYYARCFPRDQVFAGGQVETRLVEIKAFINNINKDIAVFPWISTGRSVEKVIVEKAQRLRVDLIVIGKNSHHSWFPFLNTVVPGRLAKKARTAVLTVRPGSSNEHVKTVVMTVGSTFPGIKLAIIDALKRKCRVHVRLVTFTGMRDNTAIFPHALLGAYRYLKSNPVNLVSYDILESGNRSREILNYCKKVNADVLIIDPESGTSDGWINRHISAMLPVGSATQILSVQPA